MFLSNSGYGTEFKDAADNEVSFGDVNASQGLVDFYRSMDWKPNAAGHVGLVNEAMTANDVYDKYYSSMDRSVFDAAVKADPTSRGDHAGKYVKWIMSLAMEGKWKPGDSNETRYSLALFDRFEKAKAYMKNQDINKFRSMDDLEDAIDSVKVPDSQTDIKAKGSEKVYEDADWIVIRIDTWEASRLYGAETKWCTSEKTPDAFDAYNGNGKLYLNVRKRDKPRVERLAPLAARSHRSTSANKANLLVKDILPAVCPPLRFCRATLVADALRKIGNAPPVVGKLKRSRSTLALRNELVELARAVGNVAVFPIGVPAVLRILPVVVYHRLNHEGEKFVLDRIYKIYRIAGVWGHAPR